MKYLDKKMEKINLLIVNNKRKAALELIHSTELVIGYKITVNDIIKFRLKK